MNPDYRVTHKDSNQWKLPLNLAVGFHVLIVLSSIYLPGFFKAKPKFAEIYTVSIINVAEPDIAPPPTPQVPKVKQSKAVVKKAVQPVKSKKIAPIAEPVSTTSKAPVKAVSLKPLKKKIVKKIILLNNVVRNSLMLYAKRNSSPNEQGLQKKRLKWKKAFFNPGSLLQLLSLVHQAPREPVMVKEFRALQIQVRLLECTTRLLQIGCFSFGPYLNQCRNRHTSCQLQ